MGLFFEATSKFKFYDGQLQALELWNMYIREAVAEGT